MRRFQLELLLLVRLRLHLEQSCIAHIIWLTSMDGVFRLLNHCSDKGHTLGPEISVLCFNGLKGLILDSAQLRLYKFAIWRISTSHCVRIPFCRSISRAVMHVAELIACVYHHITSVAFVVCVNGSCF